MTSREAHKQIGMERDLGTERQPLRKDRIQTHRETGKTYGDALPGEICESEESAVAVGMKSSSGSKAVRISKGFGCQTRLSTIPLR